MIKMPELGDPLPWISVPTTREALMPLNGLVGDSMILGCAGLDIDPSRIVTALENAADALVAANAYWLMVVPLQDDAAPLPRLNNPRARLIPDADGAVRRALGMPDTPDGMLSVRADTGLRVTANAHHQGPDALTETETWVAGLLKTGSVVATDIDAPVLLIPDVIEAELRDKLITAWTQGGHEDTGYLRPNQDGGMTHVVNARRKRRSDHFLDEVDALTAQVHARVRARVAPWIERATHFKIGFAERYRIACYEAESAGFFAPHRDFSDATAHRHFAMTIALNDDHRGGALRFPEFGSREYMLRAGQAIVYSGSLLHEVTPMTAGRRFALINFLTNKEGAEKVADYQRVHGESPEKKIAT
jgi:hypothetical protein